MTLMRDLQVSRDGRYSDDMIQIYHDAARLGYIADCENLAEVDFERLAEMPLSQVRDQLSIPMDLIEAYKVGIENKRLYL